MNHVKNYELEKENAQINKEKSRKSLIDVSAKL